MVKFGNVVDYTLDDIILSVLSEIASENNKDASFTYGPNRSATSQAYDSRELCVPSTIRLQRTALCEGIGESGSCHNKASNMNCEFVVVIDHQFHSESILVGG